jgi:hypothetical protein
VNGAGRPNTIETTCHHPNDDLEPQREKPHRNLPNLPRTRAESNRSRRIDELLSGNLTELVNLLI